MNRRAILGAAMLLAVPGLARTQAPGNHRVAWLSVNDAAAGAASLKPFLEGMAALGYTEGRNLLLDRRWGDYSRERLDRLVLDAAALQPAVIVTQGPALLSVHKAPGTIPVVFGYSGDPVVLGVARSLARPGGRFTGVTFMQYDLVGKRVEILREVLPGIKRLAVLSNPHHAGDAKELGSTREAAARYGLSVSHHPAGTAAELDQALAAIAAAAPDAVVVHPDALVVQQRETIARFSVKHRIPMVSGWASIAEGGNLLTYGPIQRESFRRLAYYVDRILRGASPAELPIEQPSQLELVVNLKTARALGITIPQSLLLRADRVIE